MSEFNKPYDQRKYKISGSSTEYLFTVADLKNLLVELSEIYAASRGDLGKLEAPIQAFIESEKVTDPLAAKAFEAHTVSLIERTYGLHKIDQESPLVQGKYNIAHREYRRTLHADSDLG